MWRPHDQDLSHDMSQQHQPLSVLQFLLLFALSALVFGLFSTSQQPSRRLPVTDVAFSTDGQLLAVSCSSHGVEVWDLAQVHPARRWLDLNGDGRPYLSAEVAFAAGETLVVSKLTPEGFRELIVWDHGTHGMAARLTVGSASDRLALAPGQWLAATARNTDMEGRVTIWDLRASQAAGMLPYHGQLSSLAFSEDARTLALEIGQSDRHVEIWDVAARQPKCPAIPLEVSDPFLPVGIALAPHGQQLFVGGPQRVDVWDTASGRKVKSLTAPHAEVLAGPPQVSRDGTRLIWSGPRGAVCSVDIASGQLRAEWGPLTSASAEHALTAMSPDGRVLAVVQETGLSFYEAGTGRLLSSVSREDRFLGGVLYGLGFVLWPLLWGLSRKRPRETAIRRAQQAAGEAGHHLQFGPVTACFFGRSTLAPILRQTWDSVLAAYSELAGESVAADVPLLVLVFEQDRAYRAFWNGPPPAAGVYRTGGRREIVLCEQWALDRSIEPERLLGGLLADYLFDCQKRFRASEGLAAVLGWLLTSDGEARRAASIHRMLRAALDRNEPCLQDNPLLTVLPESPRDAIYWRCQAASLAQYLAGAKLTTRREQFTQFLRELSKREALEPVLERRFGCRLSDLIENWRCWEVMQPIEQYDPPPERLRRHVAEHVLPLVREATASWDRRLEAIRHLGMSGDVDVGGVLIEMLRTAETTVAHGADSEPLAGVESDRPSRSAAAELQAFREEATWALELLSGEAFGDDVPAWQGWWERVRIQAPACASAEVQFGCDTEASAGAPEPKAVVAVPPPAGWLAPPGRLQFCWALLVIGGALAVVPAVFGILCLDGLLSWLSYVNLAVGSVAIAVGASRELHGLHTAAILLALSLCSLNVVSAAFGLVAVVLGRHAQVKEYLRLQA